MTKMFAMVASGGAIHQVDVVQHDGMHWLVPHWLDSTTSDVTMPARMILIDNLEHQRSGVAGASFTINRPFPAELLGERTPKGPVPGYIVRELPDVAFPKSIHGDDDKQGH